MIKEKYQIDEEERNMQGIELIDKRKTREKHFLQENGNIIAELYDEDIHFLKNNQYEEIDNTLILKDEYYTNTNNAYKVWFGNNPKDDLMQMEIDEYFINIKLREVSDFTLEHKTSDLKLVDQICYKNILKNIDIDYQILPTKVKESIILNNKDIDFNNLEFIIDTNLELLETDNKTISAKKNGNLIFNMETPYMVDANGQLNSNVTYHLEKTNDEYTLKLIVDKEWLESETTIYPVTIDPTITNYGQNNSVYDTYIYPGDTGVDRNSLSYLKAGVERINGKDIVNRTLIKFELPTIGTGSQIIYAELNLRGYPGLFPSAETDIVNVHRVTSQWDETTANWNSMNDKYDSKIEGSFESTRFYYYADEEKKNIVLMLCGTEITNLVKKWYSDTPNYGIMLKENKEVYRSDVIPIFFSKNNQVSGGNPKPILAITYRNQNGLESYMNYQTQSFSQGTAHVNNYNGNLTTVFDIGQTINGKLPASLKLVYNTNDVVIGNNFGYGTGYQLNLSQTIKEMIIDEITYLEYRDEDGTNHYFLNQKLKYDNDNGFVTTTYENTYYDEDGLDLVIEKSDTTYILKDKNNNVMKFTKKNNIGYLSEITDVSNNKITITYDTNNRITKVVDANTQEINISYNTNIVTITSPDQTVILNYSNNKLMSIDSLLGETVFTYNTNNVITSITDVTGKKIAYDYYEQKPYRLKKVSEYGLQNILGNYFYMNYGYNATIIVDSKNKVKTLTFNNSGNAVSTSNLKEREDVTNAYGVKTEYGESNHGINTYNNKLLSNQIPLKYINNRLTNTSFDDDTSMIKFTGGSHMTVTTSKDYANSGFKSLKLTWGVAGESTIQNVTVPKGDYYTFSAYIKTVSTPIKMALNYKDVNGNMITQKSESILSNDNFERQDITIYYPSNATSDLAIVFTSDSIGTCYIDDIQLEDGEVANHYNMLDNSDFANGLTGWNFSARDWRAGNDIAINDVFEIVSLTSNKKALRIKMNPANTTSFEKIFNVSGKGGDTYNLSFWYKNEGFAGVESMGPGPYNNVIFRFGYVEPLDGDADIYNKTFYPNESEWQYFSYNFTALRDFNSFDFRFIQAFNANNFYITNLGLLKDIRSVMYDYDEFGNIITSKGLDNQLNGFNYDKNNQLTQMTDPKGKNFTFEYDNAVTDRVLRGVSGTSISNEMEYDSFGNPLISRIINRGQATKIVAGAYKIRLKGMNKTLRLINNKITIKDDACGHDKWVLEKATLGGIDYFKIKHSIVKNKYIAVLDNNVAFTTDQGDSSLFLFTKNDNGSYLIKNKKNLTYLNNSNNTLVAKDLVENDVNFEFYLESITNGEFIENSSEYTSDGKFIQSTTDTNFNKTIYDIDTTTGLTKSVTNAKDQTTYYEYNNKKQLTSIMTGDKKVNYEYNGQNQLSKIIQDEREYRFNYDEFLNMKQVKIGDNITFVTNNYEEHNGNLLSSTYGNNDVISFEYDDFNRVQTTTKMNNTYHYKYGSNGDLIKVISNDSTIKYTYDLAKRLYEYSLDHFKIKYGYDSNNNIISKKYKLDNIEKNVINTLNDDDAIMKTTFDGKEINYQYDSLGRLNNSNLNNQFHTSYKYVTNGKRTSMLVKSIDNNNDSYSYRYDKLSNITHIYHNAVLENKYYYDEYNELIKEDNYLLKQTIRYKYDNLGNILSRKIYELNTYNQLDENKYEYNNSNWKDQLTKFNNDTITYDEIGNPLTIGNITLDWINGRQLNSYHDSNNTISYQYDKDGIRTSKTINNIETKYYVEGSSIVLEKTGNNMLYYLRSSQDGLVGLQYNNDTYYYVKNNQDDIIGILDSNYNIVANYAYDSWGNIISITDGNGNDVSSDLNHIANINPYRYRSYYYDKETNLYYLNSRYYNPVWGRFLNADIGVDTESLLGTNLYQYGYNNPINTIDNEGTWPKWLKTVAIVTVAVVAVAAITLVTVGTGTAAAVIAAGVLKGAATGAAIGAVGGAIGGAVSHTLSTGSTKGAGQAAVKGAVTGAVTGAAGGAVLGGVSSAIQVGQAASAWSAPVDKTSISAMNYHYSKHGVGNASNVIDYTNQAKNFYTSHIGDFVRKIPTDSYLQPNLHFRTPGGGLGGKFTDSGKIITFWYK